MLNTSNRRVGSEGRRTVTGFLLKLISAFGFESPHLQGGRATHYELRALSRYSHRPAPQSHSWPIPPEKSGISKLIFSLFEHSNPSPTHACTSREDII